jgi:hypothetical protein
VTLWPLATMLFAALQDDDKGFLGLHEADIAIHGELVDVTLSGIVDLEAYLIETSPPGLLFENHDPTWNARGTFFIDATVGDHLFAFVQARSDWGFDVHYMEALQVRLDEWFARWTESGDGWSLSFQAGKFATPLGNFIPRHDSLHNPLVRAPLPYDYMTTLGDGGPPPGNDAFVARRDLDDLKHLWVPIIWGPVYGRGLMAFATIGKIDARLAFTNASPSERPPEWEWHHDTLSDMNWSGRIGWNPFIGFKIGANASFGPWLRRLAAPKIAGDNHSSDYAQKLAGLDLEYSIGHLILFGEVYATEWEAPVINGDLRAASWYVEAKYKLFPGFHVAARVGQILFNRIPTSSGSRTWDHDTTRLEIGAGYFIQVNLLAKAAYEINAERGPDDVRDNVLSFSMSMEW